MPQGSASVALLPCSWSERRDWRSGESVVLTACTFLALVISAVPRLQLPENLMHMGSRGHCTAPTGAQYSPHTCTGTYVSPWGPGVTVQHPQGHSTHHTHAQALTCLLAKALL